MSLSSEFSKYFIADEMDTDRFVLFLKDIDYVLDCEETKVLLYYFKPNGLCFNTKSFQ